ncbi:DUF5682 family protein [Labrys neptuniae]|uniref:DUF5682 family protein n=1 Tax=Labrys neptuniae TaxID=376174 RepID=UPI00288E4C29|nr:DUF5682 family protein [Labrys neptuniae]MDT3380045.1 DUF5682 family protein [Labrys neptuniae]
MQPGTSSRHNKEAETVSADRAESVDGLVVIGVRHHSPACARRVEATIRRLKPAFVLIEGPTDFNPYIDDLRLPHHLPIAIFSFYSSAERSYASYSPFCSYSPEWVAVQSAFQVGATPLFCDLPAWHPDFGERANRYADPHGLRADRAVEVLGRALGEEGGDALWDALAEQTTPEELGPRLDHYFNLLRPDGADDASEMGRERFMAGYAAWALEQASGRPVVLVCGGWHAAAIERYAEQANGERPALAELNAAERTGSYVVPYDYKRLDRFTGYASGMPSPAYYEQVSKSGLDAAASWAVNEIVRRLRKSGQAVSTADRIAWQAHAQALSLTRSHNAVLRSDLLDSALSTLIKEGLDRPAAWAERGAIHSGEHPVVVAMLRALSGDRRGKLAPGARRPPLAPDVEERLRHLGLAPGSAPREVECNWTVELDRERAQTLHCLTLIDYPSVIRLFGPDKAAMAAPTERFRLIAHRDAEGRLIEASRWGGTLPMAAAAALAEQAELAEQDLGKIAVCVSRALFAGLLGLDAELGRRLEQGIGTSHDIGSLGGAGLHLVGLYRFGEIFGEEAHAGLGRIAEGLFARVLWLIEALRNEDEGLKSIEALLACRDMMRDCPQLSIERNALLEALRRIVRDAQAPSALAGAALGTLVACGDVEVAIATSRVRLFGRAERLGDFLAGMFALAREEVTDDGAVIQALTELVAGWDDDEFLRALPAMRQAFAWFPPRERERMAFAVLRAAGYSTGQADVEAMAWMRQRTRVDDQLAAMALEAKVALRLAEAGLN